MDPYPVASVCDFFLDAVAARVDVNPAFGAEAFVFMSLGMTSPSGPLSNLVILREFGGCWGFLLKGLPGASKSPFAIPPEVTRGSFHSFSLSSSSKGSVLIVVPFSPFFSDTVVDATLNGRPSFPTASHSSFPGLLILLIKLGSA